MYLRVHFTGFWKSFNPNRNIFTRALEEELNLKIRVVKDSEVADLEIASVFLLPGVLSRGLNFALSRLSETKEKEYVNKTRYGFISKPKKEKVKKIWYTGENLRTPYYSADGYLGFDKDDSSLNITYFPHWMFRLFSESNDGKLSDLSFENYLTEREPIQRDLNACTFSSSLDPRRLLIYNLLNEFLPVEKFGRAFHRQVSNKHEVSAQFGIQVCPENSITPGYVTEKILEAWSAGNVPIWEGLDSYGYFNPEAIIDITGKNSDEMRQQFATLDQSKLLSMRAQPVLIKSPSIRPLLNVFQAVLQEI
jgi:hypothetical protein